MGFNVDPSSLKLFTPCICGELKAFQNDNIVSVKTLFEFQSFVDSKTDMGKVGIMQVLLAGIFKENCGLKWGKTLIYQIRTLTNLKLNSQLVDL